MSYLIWEIVGQVRAGTYLKTCWDRQANNTAFCELASFSDQYYPADNFSP